ncbi:MAG: VWA domain-containing protein [Desulfobacterales bacterium]|nr:VWA domain-containing protein [Desulfobacterales bacterium]
MKKTYILYIVIIVMAFFISGCEDQKPPPQPPKPKAAAPPPVKKKPERMQMETGGVWPFYTDKEREDLADHFLAKSYFLIFDGSGSMGETGCSDGNPKIDVAKDAVAKWSETVPPDANLGLYAFHVDGTAVLPMAAGGRERFIQTVNDLRAGGRTPLSEAIAHAYNETTRQARRQLGYGEYTIVVVTDGVANDQPLLSHRVKQILTHSPINIFSIGFCIGEKHSLNQPGRTIYKPANNPAELRKGLQEVLAESETFDESEFSDQ